MDFQQSQTYRNLGIAFEDEAISSTRYRIYADVARNEGYMEIGDIFDVTSLHNKEHAKIWQRQRNQGFLPDTAQALEESQETEYNMASDKYQEFARIAREEGFFDIAALFAGVANIDYNQGTRFSKQLENIKQNQVFCKPEETLWICMNCGNIMSGDCAPLICPVCEYPQGYYRLFNEAVNL